MESKYLELNLINFSHLIKREMDKHKPLGCIKGLSIPNAKFIAYLISHQESDVYQKTLEEVFSLRASTVSRSLKMLEEQGYIIRTASTYDSRLKKITLTEKSLKISDSFESSIKEIYKKMTFGISEEELTLFFNIMEKMKANLMKA